MEVSIVLRGVHYVLGSTTETCECWLGRLFVVLAFQFLYFTIDRCRIMDISFVCYDRMWIWVDDRLENM